MAAVVPSPPRRPAAPPHAAPSSSTVAEKNPPPPPPSVNPNLDWWAPPPPLALIYQLAWRRHPSCHPAPPASGPAPPPPPSTVALPLPLPPTTKSDLPTGEIRCRPDRTMGHARDLSLSRGRVSTVQTGDRPIRLMSLGRFIKPDSNSMNCLKLQKSIINCTNLRKMQTQVYLNPFGEMYTMV
jgi:hypothetical protein